MKVSATAACGTGVVRRRKRLLALSALCCIACGGAGDDTNVGKSADSVPPPVTAAPYAQFDSAAAPLGGYGSLSVTVLVDSLAPADTLVFPIRDFDACGAQLTDNSVQREGDNLMGALVWIADVSQGKELSGSRRHEITHEGCMLRPRVQTATSGGTLNVRNMDRAVHVLKFADAQTGEVVARITQSERGQVVPYEYLLANARELLVICETHPWTKGWIHVFNHPYHGTSDRSGNVVLDSIPVGVRTVVVSHERFEEQRVQVMIEAGARATTRVVLGAKGR